MAREKQKSIFEKLLDKSKSEKIVAGKKSREWFRTEAKKVNSVNTTSFMNSIANKSVTVPKIGQMFIFSYDAKTKDVLPYFDRLPCIFIVEMYKDGFLGINLHYLPHVLRAKLMDALYNLTNRKALTETTKLRISYNILRQFALSPLINFCTKRYLYSHIKSKIHRIEPLEWEMALFLPLERFTVNKNRVFKDALKRTL